MIECFSTGQKRATFGLCREVLKIEVYDQDGNYRGDWHDTGCNTLLVKSVSIIKE